MDAPANDALVAPDSVAEPIALTLVALPPPAKQPSFDLTHAYFESVYAATLGPSAVLLGRRLGRVLASAPGQSPTVCPVDLARELGMRSVSGDPLGKRSLLKRAIDRLEHDRIVRWLEPHHLGVVIAVPPVSERVYRRLPDGARRAHDQLLAVIDLRD